MRESFLAQGIADYDILRFMNKKCSFKYAGAMVLGMHDALVEITGILAGLAFAVDSRRVIVMTGAIPAVAASLSMAAANYMAERTNKNPHAFICAMYTGAMYVVTSAAVILPFCLIPNRGWALGIMGLIAVGIIFIFNLIIGRDGARSFIERFTEMLAVCVGVSVTSFAIGQAAKFFLGVNI